MEIASVDANREDLIEALERGIMLIERASDMTPKERERTLIRLTKRAIRAAVTGGTVEGIYHFLHDALERDPQRLRERAEIAAEDGEADKAQRLLKVASDIEARRGNG